MNKRLTAYRLSDKSMEIVPAPLRRDWMEATPKGHAYRCLPLDIANQHGWFLLAPDDLTLVWDGSDAHDAIAIVGNESGLCQSHFGFGIVTFEIPYLFRTEPGFNLHITGAPNVFRDGIQNLEGVVETDWAPQTFTVNLKLTRANHPICLEKGTPIARIMPVRRADIETFAPEFLEISQDPALAEEHQKFVRKRGYTYTVNEKLRDSGRGLRYDQDYFRGEGVSGSARHPDHRTKLRLRPFKGDR